ncbi:MAG: sigma-54-dependent Fis family transcriptional regulator [Myxococcales bacterium]|nr:sigma-54-dependent Fis family transcriptional regulator [Myxococcales bacterium]
MNHAILVVDDEQNMRIVLQAMLQREGYTVFTAEDGQQAIELLRSKPVQVVVSDLKMPRMDGMELFHFVRNHYPVVPFIIMTAHGTVDSAVEALKLGAFDYISKPFDKSELKLAIEKATRTFELNANSHVERSGEIDGSRFGIIGSSREIRRVFEVIDKVADTPSTVLITGESGTGKELVATALHEQSSRRERPFIKVNLAAIPKTLIESELFGHEKGAFTGAINSKPGRFELAHNGTLFLDEIGEIPVEVQVKLLRVIQEQEFERVGGIKTYKVEVRLVAATNRDLQKSCEEGSFREDLYYRLNVVPIHLPPLRQRREDIAMLTGHFLKKYNRKLSKNLKGIDDEALAKLKTYHWPGNIRELENVMERLVLFCDGDEIGADDLPEGISQGAPGTPHVNVMPVTGVGLKEIVRETTAQVERELIIQALRETKGNVTHAAQKLMISRKSLQNKMKEFDLRDTEF